jgi:hypothetical protein
MDAGIGEAMLISAAIGAGTGAAGSAVGGGDPLKGALQGALMGGVTGGVGAGIGGLSGASAGLTAAGEAGAGLGGAEAGLGAMGAGSGELGALTANEAILSGMGYPTVNPALTMPTVSPYTSANPFTSTGELPIPQDFAGMQNPNMPQMAQNPPAQSPKGMLDFGYKGTSPNAFGYGPQSNLGLAGIGAGTGLTAAMQAERDKYKPPGVDPYTGILSKYDPYTARGVQYPTRFAEGGIAALAMGGQPNQMYPMSQQEHTNFMEPTQLPSNAMAVRNFEPATNPMSGMATQAMASGGITSLGSYSDGGRLLRGPGDGMSDNIPATIGRKQPARLADGEFVVPADVVSHLGNGSTDAGAKNLYSMMNNVRKARTGNSKQGKQINPGKYIPA